jgi:hypothetical protein
LPGNCGARPGTSGKLCRRAQSATLARILESRTFRDAPVLSRLLRHLVDHALRGEADRLKEYAVGLEVFGRRESFDPRTDTIVRVQARRLRARLKEYYEAEGRGDSVIIDVPRGHYVAVFRPAPDNASGPSLPAPRTRLIGRERELEAVRGLLVSEGARLVTLTGAGGSGKTRLALQVLTKLEKECPGGIYFAPLAPVPTRAAWPPPSRRPSSSGTPGKDASRGAAGPRTTQNGTRTLLFLEQRAPAPRRAAHRRTPEAALLSRHW